MGNRKVKTVMFERTADLIPLVLEIKNKNKVSEQTNKQRKIPLIKLADGQQVAVLLHGRGNTSWKCGRVDPGQTIMKSQR